MHRWISFAILISSWVFAAHQQDAPIYLTAGQVSINQTTHLGQYVEHVKLDQGSTHLRAHFAETKTNDHNQLIFAMAKGNASQQAHIWTHTSDDKPPLHAYADKICYFPLQHRVKLIGHARIIQDENSFSAPEIIYDTLSQHVSTELSQQGQTVIIFKQTHEHFIR